MGFPIPIALFSIFHCVLPAKFEGILSWFSEYLEKPLSPNLNSEFIDLYSDLALIHLYILYCQDLEF